MNVWYRSNTLIWARHRLQLQKKLPMSTHSALENQMTSTHTLRAISIYSVPMVKVISKLVPRDSTLTPLATVTGPTMLSVSQTLISKVDSLPQLSWFSLHTCQFYYHTIKKVKTKLLLESIWVTQSEYHSYYQGCFFHAPSIYKRLERFREHIVESVGVDYFARFSGLSVYHTQL